MIPDQIFSSSVSSGYKRVQFRQRKVYIHRQAISRTMIGSIVLEERAQGEEVKEKRLAR